MSVYISPFLACTSACVMAALQLQQVRDTINSKFGRSADKVITIWALFTGILAGSFLDEPYRFIVGFPLMSYLFMSIKVMEDKDLGYKIKHIGLSILVGTALGLSISATFRSLRN